MFPPVTVLAYVFHVGTVSITLVLRTFFEMNTRFASVADLGMSDIGVQRSP